MFRALIGRGFIWNLQILLLQSGIGALRGHHGPIIASTEKAQRIKLLDPLCFLVRTGLAVGRGTLNHPVLFQFKRAGIELVIGALFRNQAIMAASFNDLAVIKNHDAVGIADRREAVSNDKYRSALHQLIHTVLYQGLRTGINGGCGFVQNHNGGIGHRGSCNRDQLPLSLAQAAAVALQDGIVNVSAMDKDTGKRQEITIQGSSNMSREEIDRAVREAQQYAAEDARARSDAQIKDRLESLLYQSEEIRKTVDKEQRKQLDEAIKTAKRALKHRDTGEMTAAAETLEAFVGSRDNAGSTP